MSDDEYGADADLLAAMASAPIPSQPPNRPPQRVTQPTPQRLDPRPPTQNSIGAKIVQPAPQALTKLSSGSSILVSPRQKGNPILSNLKSQPWEYSDSHPADYVLGATTCALFLSLKYHRLHPEYIYTRIRNLKGMYNLRVVLALVDIPAHEEILRELAKTSLISNITLILCWSAAEGARYLELFKSYEHAPPTGIQGVQKRTYKERVEEFVTVPRGVNKTDAMSLVSAFGSVRGAVNSDPEVVVALGGWGERKVKAWSEVVQEPFMRAGAKRKRGEGGVEAVPLSRMPLREMDSYARRTIAEDDAASLTLHAGGSLEGRDPLEDIYGDDIVIAAELEAEDRARRKMIEEEKEKEKLSGGVAEALARLRKE